jgi:TonB family protein
MKKCAWCLVLAPLLLTLASGPVRADSQADVAAALAKAQGLSSRGDQRNACKAYQHASELAQGKSAASLMGLSNCYSQAKDAAQAIATARQALAVAGTSEERTEATLLLGLDLLRQTDEKARTEALSVFKEQMASGDAKIQGSYLTALLVLHRDEEAARVVQDLRNQGKSAEDLQRAFFRISYPGPLDDPAVNDFNERLHRLAPSAPLRVGGKLSRPEILHQVKPETTEEALRHQGFSGTVILETIIDTEGKVTDVRVLKGQPMGLTEAAVNAVKQWTFKPATLDGQPVQVFYVLTVDFKIGPLHPSPWPNQ